MYTALHCTSNQSFNYSEYFAKHPQPYKIDGVEVDINEEGDGLKAYITTPRLYLESMERDNESDPANKGHQACYERLVTDEEVMALYGDGRRHDESRAKGRSEQLVSRWEKRNPLSGFIVSLRDEGNKLKSNTIKSLSYDAGVGWAVLGGGGEYVENTAQIAGLYRSFDNKFLKAGYASEVAYSIVNVYPGQLNIQGKKLLGKELFPYRGIEASTRPDNVRSIGALLNAGMDIICRGQEDVALQNLSWETKHIIRSKWGEGGKGQRHIFYKSVNASTENAQNTKDVLPNAYELLDKFV